VNNPEMSYAPVRVAWRSVFAPTSDGGTWLARTRTRNTQERGSASVRALPVSASLAKSPSIARGERGEQRRRQSWRQSTGGGAQEPEQSVTCEPKLR
jgi:hypothetical protein